MSTSYNGSAYTDQNPVAKTKAWEFLPANLAALQASSTTFLVPPGFTEYTAGNKPSGFADLGSGSGFSIGGGTVAGGVYTAADAFFILCDLAQAESASGGSGSPVKFYELNTCEGGDDTYYRIFFCSDKYHH